MELAGLINAPSFIHAKPVIHVSNPLRGRTGPAKEYVQRSFAVLALASKFVVGMSAEKPIKKDLTHCCRCTLTRIMQVRTARRKEGSRTQVTETESNIERMDGTTKTTKEKQEWTTGHIKANTNPAEAPSVRLRSPCGRSQARVASRSRRRRSPHWSQH